MPGYDANFFSGFRLSLPKLTASQMKQRAPIKGRARRYELTYTHFSVLQNKKRKFAFYTATNIDGNTWKAMVSDRIEFEREILIADDHQVGDELYDFLQSRTDNDFDKGHITKFQDPQWGDDVTIIRAADDTMKFVNCVPQHHKLNRGAWKSLEDYILKKFTRKTGPNGRKVTVLAGPLLRDNDPFYIDKINGKPLQIPCYFWKVVVYPNRQNELTAAGFLMSQRNILFKHGFVVHKKKDVRQLISVAEADFFKDFASGEPYQVSIPFLEEATGFSFGVDHLHQPYTSTEPTEIIYKRVEVPASIRQLEGLALKDSPLHFTLEGIRL
jgi:endonuclease G, mitochondrial